MKDVLEVIKRVLKKVKLSTVLLLFFLLSTNVFAWFIYTTKVDSNITAHVKAWNVSNCCNPCAQKTCVSA